MWKELLDSKSMRNSCFLKRFRSKPWKLKSWRFKRKICLRNEKWSKLRLRCKRKLSSKSFKRWKSKERLTLKPSKNLASNLLKVYPLRKEIQSQNYQGREATTKTRRWESMERRTQEWQKHNLQRKSMKQITTIRNMWRSLKRNQKAKGQVRFKLITNFQIIPNLIEEDRLSNQSASFE